LTIANDFQRIVENGRTNSGLYKLKLEEMIKEKKKKKKLRRKRDGEFVENQSRKEVLFLRMSEII
jgi:ribosome-binding protein aMBF1 (putative translation factor)